MKAALFDVYETILTGSRQTEREAPLRKVAENHGLRFPLSESLSERLDREIQLDHQNSEALHPEVDIRRIWQRIFPSLDAPDSFTLAAEEAIHPVKLIPQAKELILEYHTSGIKLGIVSNAQAYTRSLLKTHLQEAWDYFDPDLLFFSYSHGVSKPGLDLFELAIRRLATYSILPSETLMIGDSEINDIQPALRVGMQTHKVVW